MALSSSTSRGCAAATAPPQKCNKQSFKSSLTSLLRCMLGFVAAVAIQFMKCKFLLVCACETQEDVALSYMEGRLSKACGVAIAIGIPLAAVGVPLIHLSAFVTTRALIAVSHCAKRSFVFSSRLDAGHEENRRSIGCSEKQAAPGSVNQLLQISLNRRRVGRRHRDLPNSASIRSFKGLHGQ